jgi:hypothetical protein
MPVMPKPSETVSLVLRYEGPEVDDGSMSLEDIVPVLQGFASAYGKIAAQQGIGVQHRLRITGVRQSSADILLEVWDALGRMADPLQSVEILSGAAITIVTTIVGVIRLKKHLKKKPFETKIAQENMISVVNSDGLAIEMPINVYNIFQSKLVDQDIAKIARPLEPGRIDAAEIIASAASIRERIVASERQYLDAEEVTVTTTRETWITGKLNSLTKSTDSGFLLLTDGTRVFYKWMGWNPRKLHRIFGTYDGPVQVYGVAHMDESLKVTQIDITDIEKVQGELFPVETDESS